MDHEVSFVPLAFLPLPLATSYVELTRLPSTRTCDPFLIAAAMCSARRGRKIATRCHSVFETHSSSAFFQERCVATESTVNFAPLLLTWRCSGSAPTNPIKETELRYGMFFLVFLPHFLGAPKGKWILLPRRAPAFWEGPDGFKGGTGKAEDAKAPGAGIIPKRCPRKGAAEKETLTSVSEIGSRGRTRQFRCGDAAG